MTIIEPAARSGPALRRVRFSLLAVLAMAASMHLTPGRALAQAPGSGFASNVGANANKPVNIEADSLEVDDRKKTAVFRGNVSATQGDVNLKAKELFVTYSNSNANAGGKKTANAASNDAGATASPLGGGGEITQIDAKGNVFVTMKPEKEGDKVQTAKSDWAIFNVKKQLVTLGGDVVLSQGENVMRGSKLVVDLTSGITTFENPGGGGGTGRIQSIFTPPPKEKDKEKDKEKAGKEGKDARKAAQ